MDSRPTFAIDVGGGSAKLALVKYDGSILDRGAVFHKEGMTAEEIAQQYIASARTMQESRGNLSFAAAGIGLPGHIDQVGRTSQKSNVPALDGFPLADRLSSEFQCETYIANDADLAALAEAKLASGRGSERFLMVTLGTGIGVAFVNEGIVENTAHGALGDAGHIIVDHNSQRRCRLGCTGCVEAIASGDRLANAAQTLVATGDDPSMAPIARLMHLAQAGEAQAEAIVDEAVSALGAALTSWHAIFAPDRICFGGGIIHLAPWIPTRIRAAALQKCMPRSMDTVSIVTAQLGNDAGVIGAGLLAHAEVNGLKEI